MNLKDVFENWQPSCMTDSDPERAKLVTACLRYRRELLRMDPWLPFPQAVTAFMFGRSASSLPVGALFLQWDCGEPFVSACPSCGGSLYTFGFGWSFFHPVLTAVCIGCTKRFYRRSERNICVLRDIVNEPLEGTAFYVRHMEIYRVFAGQRKPLWSALKLIGAQELPSEEWATAFEPLTVVSKTDPERRWSVKTFLEITPRKTGSDLEQG